MPVDFHYSLRRSSSMACLPRRPIDPHPIRRASRTRSATRLIQSVPSFDQGGHELRYSYPYQPLGGAGTHYPDYTPSGPHSHSYARLHTNSKPYLSYWPYYSFSAPHHYKQSDILPKFTSRSHLDSSYTRSYLRPTHETPGMWHSYWLSPSFCKRRVWNWYNSHVDTGNMRFY